MKTSEIRKRFVAFFERHAHARVASSSLVPHDDPTLTFTNAGMVQFKNVFLGLEKPAHKRAVSVQRCVRAGGKHNDLENVGYTARHHTFFEMLGNFSFGDYFKREAIQFAWEFLTVELKLPPERLWVTVFTDDDEAADVWLKEIRVDPARFTRIGASDNFWSMGDTGPCGPCSEIFYDHGPAVAGGPPGSPEADGDRYVEIWNLVFMQYNRAADGTLTPLPQPSVDTGMGLERLAAVMQGVHSNYDTDLFRHLIDAAARIVGTRDRGDHSLRVLADHIRSTAFLIADGVAPSNEGRGYVLRRIIRRAVRHARKLGAPSPSFYRLVEPLVEEMGGAYPELRAEAARVADALRLEEAQFTETLEQGLRIFEQALAGLAGATIPGDVAFRLYDTYGFPVDLTADLARERGLEIDMAAFDAAMAAQQERSRAASKFKAGAQLEYRGPKTRFLGYETLSDEGRVVALYRDGAPVERLGQGEAGIVVLDRTPFYAESGGQAGDCGELTRGGVCLTLFAVEDTQKIHADAFGHYGVVKTGELALGDTVAARVDGDKRTRTMRHHSATHLMHKALREVLGRHVQQKGSLVDDVKTRFDFSHNAPVTVEELRRVEAIVNAEILENTATQSRVMPVAEAQKSGAMMLFGEKYGDEVRVLDIGSSRELCGGTHVKRTGDIGLFRIVSETGVAAGVRRIEAVTGLGALEFVSRHAALLDEAGALLKGTREEIPQRLRQLLERVRKLEKEKEQLTQRLSSGGGSDLASRVQDVKGVKVLAATLDGADVKTLRTTIDRLRDQLGRAVVALATEQEGRVTVIVGISKELTPGLNAGELVAKISARLGGKGGGRPDMAQGGGPNAAALPEGLAAVAEWVAERL